MRKQLKRSGAENTVKMKTPLGSKYCSLENELCRGKLWVRLHGYVGVVSTYIPVIHSSIFINGFTEEAE